LWFSGLLVEPKPNPNLPLPSGRVAMMTTKTPAEPWETVERTLVAMLYQEYPTPFDVWLADEDPSPETISWCQRNKVGIVSRKGIPEFNRSSYPGQTKTKEGNTLFWYVTIGYDSYDFVVQMDVDHAPMDQYISNT
jgi:cellulose synthase (UDP-forming)